MKGKYCKQCPGDDLSSQKFLQVFSALMVLTSLFGMERGVAPSQSSPGRCSQYIFKIFQTFFTILNKKDSPKTEQKVI